MKSGTMDKKLLLGISLGGAALMSVLTLAALADAEEFSADDADMASMQPGAMPAGYGDPDRPNGQQAGAPPSGARSQGDAQQALAGLTQIRQQQCQSGNQLACQVLPQMPGYQQQLTQMDQGCRSGDSQACNAYDSLAQQIFTAYSESAAVMQAGEASMAQMDAWRAQMNQNAANRMANLRAQGAAGQAAHNARQESYAAMNRNWEAGQASIDRGHGRFIDSIYEGTTMDGGGVQTRVPHGSTGYTDGYGNVVAVPEGNAGPDGWQAMNPTYAAP
ncbi:hypothetical protein GRI97_06925 [Altererythrobacter xixiisoli]|uniref:Uncharacterized protein n=1 Tax=Croceibacterium xixiisoli TaxID=1476466 RepID=A0A6I4TRE5_9SPHN|nr:hypothetical protein [Croceibacterium xixiisoli]MXO98715.1 hypothetical protein [Croceibacterium xixiisoli]